MIHREMEGEIMDYIVNFIRLVASSTESYSMMGLYQPQRKKQRK